VKLEMKRILFDSYKQAYGKFQDMVHRRSCNGVWSSAATYHID